MKRPTTAVVAENSRCNPMTLNNDDFYFVPFPIFVVVVCVVFCRNRRRWCCWIWIAKASWCFVWSQPDGWWIVNCHTSEPTICISRIQNDRVRWWCQRRRWWWWCAHVATTVAWREWRERHRKKRENKHWSWCMATEWRCEDTVSVGCEKVINMHGFVRTTVALVWPVCVLSVFEFMTLSLFHIMFGKRDTEND